MACKWCRCCGSKKEKAVMDIRRNRGCTDILFLVAFLASWAISVMVLSLAKTEGADMYRVLYGVDMYGRTCGRSEGVEDLKLAAFPSTDHYSYVICVDSCSRTNEDDYTVAGDKSFGMAGKYETTEFLGYCFPSLSSSVSVSIQLDADGNSNSFNQAIGDIQNSWTVILASLFVALLVTISVCWIMKWCAGFVVWFCLFGFATGGTVFAAYLIYWADANADSAKPDESAQDFAYALGGILIAVVVIFLCVVLALFSRIRIAVEVIKESARCVVDMFLVLFFPLAPLFFFVVYMFAWLAGALTINSVGTATEVTTPTTLLTFGADHSASGSSNGNPATSTLYLSDSSFWYADWFFFYFAYLVLAGAVADWYFTPSDARGRRVRGKEQGQLNWPLWSSIKRTLRYHLGTVAVTSLIIAVIKFVRFVVHYIEKKCKGNPPNKLQKAVFCMIHCCLWWLECCLDKVNKNALIWCAIYGDNFFSSACSSFALIWRNLARVAALHVVSNLVFFIAKLMVGVSTAGLCGLVLVYVPYFQDTISSPLAPSLVIFMIGFTVASLFLSVFHAAIDAIFLCFLVDSENNEKGSMRASKALQRLVGKYEKDSEKKAKAANETRDARNVPKEEGSAMVAPLEEGV